jgi:hypothetical protein
VNKGSLNLTVFSHTVWIERDAMLDSELDSREGLGSFLRNYKAWKYLFPGLWRRCHLFCCNVG